MFSPSSLSLQPVPCTHPRGSAHGELYTRCITRRTTYLQHIEQTLLVRGKASYLTHNLADDLSALGQLLSGTDMADIQASVSCTRGVASVLLARAAHQAELATYTLSLAWALLDLQGLHNMALLQAYHGTLHHDFTVNCCVICSQV